MYTIHSVIYIYIASLIYKLSFLLYVHALTTTSNHVSVWRTGVPQCSPPSGSGTCSILSSLNRVVVSCSCGSTSECRGQPSYDVIGRVTSVWLVDVTSVIWRHGKSNECLINSRQSSYDVIGRLTSVCLFDVTYDNQLVILFCTLSCRANVSEWTCLAY